MKYYLYLSESKIQMLYPQIPNRKIITEAKIGVQIAGLSFKENIPKDTLYSMMDEVEDYIIKNEIIGTIDFPGSYFEGQLPMTYGIFQDYASDMTYFKAETNETIIILIGRSKNIVGISENEKTENTKEVKSLNYYTLKYVNEFLESDNDDDIIPSGENPWTNENLAKIFKSSIDKISGPEQNLNFLAKKLYHIETEDKNILLGTPLYVELKE